MFSRTEISYKTILFIFAIIALIWFVLQIRDILFLMFIAFIFTSALRPIVDWLEERRLPRIIGILLTYIVLLSFISISLASTIPSLIVQSTRLIQFIPSIIARVIPYWNIDINTFSQQLAPIGENIVKVTVGIFSNIVTTLTVLVFSFYFLLERKHAEQTLSGFFGEDGAKKTIYVIRNIEHRLGSWVQGQLILMLIIGVFSYIGLLLLRVEYALPLAILAGFLEIVPTIGPIISAIPAILVAFSVTPILALGVLALYFLIHQTENNLIVPFIMKRSVGMSPLITIASLMIGAKLAGISGAILAVPTVLVIQEIVRVYFSGIKKES